MKKIYFFLVIPLLINLTSCGSSDNDPVIEDTLENEIIISKDKFFDVNQKGSTFSVNITSDEPWSASSDQSWCTVSPISSNETVTKITITVSKNEQATDRKANIRVSTSSNSETIEINQNGIGEVADYRYKMNVIFHVLYQDRNDNLQYVDANRLKTVLENTNKLFNNSIAGDLMNVEFMMAEKDPNGNVMEIPGVDYVRWEEEYPINETEFMSDNTRKYHYLVWDPNNYINVMIYNFKRRSSTSISLGIAHLPYTTTGKNLLEGLSDVPFTYMTKDNIKFPLSISINSLYINEETTPSNYSALDINVTSAHEFGHYLGLLHTFSQDFSNQCQDVDYCDDTPYYNRFVYDSRLREYLDNNDTENLTFANLVKRTSCDGEDYESTNLMDYAISYANQFTMQQGERVRHVMEYSPLIPGPKRTSTASRSAEHLGVLDLPVKWINCGIACKRQ